MNTNLFEDFQEKIESQLKKTEIEIQKEKESTLFGIECTMEGAADKTELASLNRQHDVAEKQFEEQLLNQRTKIIKEYLITMEKLMKNIQKVYCQELKNNNFRKGDQNEQQHRARG